MLDAKLKDEYYKQRFTQMDQCFFGDTLRLECWDFINIYYTSTKVYVCSNVKTALIIISILIVAFIILLFILGVLSKSGKAPGLVEGSLTQCPNKPNCVCSEQKDASKHYINPMIIPQNIKFDILPILKNAIRDMGGSIQAESDNYIASIFSSAIFGFVDDLEIRIDTNKKVIHIRSASRVGYGDTGVNKKRAELLKKLCNRKLSEANQLLNAMPKSGVH